MATVRNTKERRIVNDRRWLQLINFLYWDDRGATTIQCDGYKIYLTRDPAKPPYVVMRVQEDSGAQSSLSTDSAAINY